MRKPPTESLKRCSYLGKLKERCLRKLGVDDWIIHLIKAMYSVADGAVSALIDYSWKAFELPSILTNRTIRIKVGGNVFNIV